VLRVELHDTPVANGSKVPTIMLGEKLNNIEEFAQLRNVMGAHFNELAFQLKDADGIKFGKMVLELADAIIHPDHGWPGSDKSGEYWSNGRKSRRLFPLKRPS
jgi:hypothetical protein